MTYDAKMLNATTAEKVAAFEWLREFAIKGGTDWRKAGIALEEWARLGRVDKEALALLRELNDALSIPGWLQPRVDAVLDGSESGKPFASIPCEYTGGNCTRGYCRRERVCQAMENRHQPQKSTEPDGA